MTSCNCNFSDCEHRRGEALAEPEWTRLTIPSQLFICTLISLGSLLCSLATLAVLLTR